jgi:hypothetical protein
MLGALVFYAYLLVYFRRDRMPAAYGALAFISITSMIAVGRVVPAPRYLAVAWPFDWVLALRHIAVRRLMLAAFLVLYRVFAWLTFTWRYAP